MPRTRRPRHGSLEFYPRVRARRIYPRIRSAGQDKKARPLAYPAYKVGMTHLTYTDMKSGSPTFRREVVSAVTVLEVPEVWTVAIRYYKKTSEGMKSDGEKWADVSKMKFVQRKYPKKKNAEKPVENYDDLTLIVATKPGSTGLARKKAEIFEIPLSGSMEEKKELAESLLGKKLDISEVFSEGEVIDVTAVTKGKGFQGVVKRFGVRIQGRKDKQHHRHIGSHGQERPGKLRWQVPMPGQMGFHQRTELNKQILKISEPLNVKGGWVGYGIMKSKAVIIRGSVPGPRKRMVMLRKSLRSGKVEPVQISYISLESKQGA